MERFNNIVSTELNKIRIHNEKVDKVKNSLRGHPIQENLFHLNKDAKPLKKWNVPKQQNVMLASLFADEDMPKHSLRVLHCGDSIQFITALNGKHKKLTYRYACRERLCPICQKVLAHVTDRHLLTMINWLNSQHTKAGNSKYHLLFVTFTIPNIKLKKHLCMSNIKAVHDGVCYLNSSIKKLLNHLRGWGKHTRGKDAGRSFNGRLLGAFIKNEYTINARLFSVNAHAHGVLIVHGSYFNSKYYLNSKQWQKLWTQATGHSYRIYVEAPYYKKNGHKVHLSDCHNLSEQKKCLHHMSLEMSKYESKSVDFAKILKIDGKKGHRQYISRPLTLVVFDALYRGLKYQRHFRYYGLFRDLHKKLVDGALDKFTPSNHKVVYSLDLKGVYDFKDKEYHHTYSLMTDEEKLSYRHKFHVKTAPTKIERHDGNDEDYKVYLMNKKADDKSFRQARINHFLNMMHDNDIDKVYNADGSKLLFVGTKSEADKFIASRIMG